MLKSKDYYMNKKRVRSWKRAEKEHEKNAADVQKNELKDMTEEHSRKLKKLNLKLLRSAFTKKN